MPSDTLPVETILKLVGLVAAMLAVLAFIGRWMIGSSLDLARSGHAWFRNTRLWRGTRAWRGHAKARFPGTYRFIRGRLDTFSFAGLPLTLIVLAAAYLAFLLGGLTEEILEADSVEAADHAIMGLIAPLRAPALIPVAIWITDLGGMPALTLVALIATGFMWTHGPRRYIAPVWLTVAGSQITTWGGKFLINRPRPDFILDVTAYSPAFPSGHATGAAAVLGIVAYVIARDMTQPRFRFAVAYCSLIVIALIGFSRVFLNVHYPSDVAAGFLVGAFWVLAGIALAELTRGKTE